MSYCKNEYVAQVRWSSPLISTLKNGIKENVQVRITNGIICCPLLFLKKVIGETIRLNVVRPPICFMYSRKGRKRGND